MQRGDSTSITFLSILDWLNGTLRGIFRADRMPECGDGVLQVDVGEECDDDNTDDGDGCSADCQLEDFCTQVCASPDALHVGQSNAPVAGTPGDDILCGDDRDNVLRGKGGNDTLCGFDGDDCVPFEFRGIDNLVWWTICGRTASHS